MYMHYSFQKSGLREELERDRANFKAQLTESREERVKAVAAAEAAVRAEMADVQKRMAAITDHVGDVERELQRVARARDSVRKDLLALQSAIAPTVRDVRKQVGSDTFLQLHTHTHTHTHTVLATAYLKYRLSSLSFVWH